MSFTCDCWGIGHKPGTWGPSPPRTSSGRQGPSSLQPSYFPQDCFPLGMPESLPPVSVVCQAHHSTQLTCPAHLSMGFLALSAGWTWPKLPGLCSVGGKGPASNAWQKGDRRVVFAWRSGDSSQIALCFTNLAHYSLSELTRAECRLCFKSEWTDLT